MRNITVGHHVNMPFVEHNLGNGYNYGKMANWKCNVVVPMVDKAPEGEAMTEIISHKYFKKRPIDLFFMGQWDERDGYRGCFFC